MTTVDRTQDDIVKLFYRLQRTFVFHGVLIGVLALLAQGTRGGNEALAADGCEDVVGRQAVLGHHIRLHPDTQRVGVTQGHNIAYTGDTHQSGTDVDIDIVGDKVRVILAVGGFQGTDVQDVALLFHHLYAYLRYVRREEGGGPGNAVLHVHSRDIGVGSLFKVHLDAHIARGGCRTGDIGHARYAVDILFQRLDHALHDGVGIRTGVGCGYAHGRRCDVRVLLDGQGNHADDTHQRDDNRYGTRHYIAIDENIVLHKLKQYLLPFLYVVGSDGNNAVAYVEAA